MDKQNFELKDRFPLSTQSLTFMQDMIMAASRLALIGGNNYILSGCTAQGNAVTPGIIVINGEVMPFEGGAVGDTITIIETAEAVSANGLTFENARVKRYAKFATGSGENYYPWSDFKPLQTNKQLEEAKATVSYVDEKIAGIQAGSIPTGVIVMWSDSVSDIPKGWQLCDNSLIPGTNTRTPDLRGKFIVGYNNDDSDYNRIGNKGGSKQVTLSVDQMPRHSHVYSRYEYSGSERGWFSDKSNVNSAHVENNTNIVGGGKAHENRPPYYVLAFIIKIDIK